MEQLPYIDEHSTRIEATREDTWRALTSVVRTDLGAHAPASMLSLLGVLPAAWAGEWRGTPRVGDTLPGFAVDELEYPGRLALCGRHRFSRYALVFELDEAGANGCVLRAQTWAEFPGLRGRGYRALVIGTRAHRVVVRRLLRRVKSRA
jgi:hypothetical protein